VNKIILLPLLLLAVYAQAQPKLVGTLMYNGPRQGGSIFRTDLPGTTPGAIHAFDNFSLHQPMGGVCAGDGLWLYGCLRFDGTGNQGALYRIRQDGGGFTKVSDLNTSSNVSMPYYHSDGNIYVGAEFQLKKHDPVANTTTDIPFNAMVYVRNLLIDADDWVYYTGEPFSALRKMKTDGTQQTVLHAFDPATDGNNGAPGVTEIPGDSLFGVCMGGGANDGGTLFSIRKDGTQFTVHHHFTSATGMYPESKLVYFDGKLYGTTSQGGDFGYGVLYTINTDGSGYRVLYHFTAAGAAPNPAGNIAITSNGRIFGSYSQFYSSGGLAYRLFKVDTSGSNFQNFYSVDQRESGHFNQDILLTDDETIYLATATMGRHDGGVLNMADTATGGFSIHHFGYTPTGFRPASPLIRSVNKLYGVCTIGGITGNGVVFSTNIDGSAYTVLHEFSDAEGYQPHGRLREASDGKLYGVCQYGGGGNRGCIYRLDKNGSNFQIVYNFPDLAQGYWPVGGLTEDGTGALYGITYASFPGSSAVFKINKDGSNYTVLKLFNNTDIHYPFDGLVLSGNYLYGSCGYGGVENKGGIFRIQTNGTNYSVLHEFAGINDGANPMATPIIASNGKLYGTTTNGGDQGIGTVYSIEASGTNYTVLRSLSMTAEGGYPQSGIMQASDGLLYGTTFLSQTSGGAGILFSMNLNGTGFTIVKTFNGTTEGQGASTMLDLNGNFSLPVQWLSFSGMQQQQKVLLNWQTATEQSSLRFDIERSAPGTAFVKIGSVAGKSQSATTASYRFTDQHPLNGINYYRLKQVDIDGAFTYSKIVTIQTGQPAKVVLSPNPASNQLTVQLPAGTRVTKACILDAGGRLVVQQNIPPQSATVSINIRQLPKGWYTLRLTGAETVQVPFIK
jgi:uncharacterized repeat protein (TIGR03803 family)